MPSPYFFAAGAAMIKKLLESAIANAEHNDGADIDALKVKEIHVERGSFQRRFHARAKGRGFKIVKPSCHIFVTVGDEPAKRRGGAKAAGARKRPR